MAARRNTASQQGERLDVEDAIRRRAHELYEQRGRAPGHAMDDWLRAEAEVKQARASRAEELKSRRAGLEIPAKQRSEIAEDANRARQAKPKKSRQPQD